MDKHDDKKSLFGYLLLVTFFIALVVSYVRFSAYPYYLQFDMDLSTTIDTLLINSEYLPDNVNHPSYGMYVLFPLVSAIAKSRHVIAISNLGDLRSCLNPATCMAEYTDFLRSISPLVSVVIPLLLAIALWIGFEKKKGHLLLIGLFLLCLFFEESLVYNSLIIRSELYAMLFWSLGLVFVALSVDASSKKHAMHLIVAGIFAGLCFTTKFQFIFYVLFLYGLYFLLLAMRENHSAQIYTPKVLLIVNTVAMGALVYAFYVSSEFNFKDGFGNILPVGSLNTFGRMLIMSVVVTTVISGLPLISKFKRVEQIWPLANVTFINLGVVASFFAGYVLSIYLPHPVEIMPQALKMAFFRDAGSVSLANFSPSELSIYFGSMREFLSARWEIYILVLCGIGIIASNVVHLRKRERNGKLKGIFLTSMVACLLIIVLANIYFTVRPISRDLLIAKLLILSFLFCAVMVGLIVHNNALYMRMFAVAVLVVLLLTNMQRYYYMKNIVTAENIHQGFGDYRWLLGVYGGNQLLYKEIMVQSDVAANGQGWANGRIAARNIDDNKKMLRTIFINQNVDASKISYVYDFFPVFANDNEIRIKMAARHLYGSLIYNNSHVKTRKDRLLKGAYYEIPGLYRLYAFEKPRTKPPQKETLAILPRGDQRVFIYLIKGKYDDVAKKYGLTMLPGQEIEMINGTVYDAYQVVNYTEIANRDIKDDYFFLITAS